MSYLVCFVLSLVILGSAVIKLARSRTRFRQAITLILLTVLAISIIMIFPLYREAYDWATSLVFSVLYGFRVLAGRQPTDVLLGLTVGGWLQTAYHALLYPLFILAPVLTTGVVLTFIGNFSDLVRYTFCFKKELHVFSQLNDYSLALAESIANGKNAIIFCNEKNKAGHRDESLTLRLAQINAIAINSSEQEIHIRRQRRVCFYQMALNEDESVHAALSLIEKYREARDKEVQVILFANGPIPEISIDSVAKGRVKTRLVDPIRSTCYHMLDHQPLFTADSDRLLSLLIIGAGDTGTEMLRAAVWCGQVEGYRLKINVIDLKAEQRRAMLAKQCPELLNGEYDLNFFAADVRSADFSRLLGQHCRDTDYVVISLDNDDLNIETGVFVRQFLLSQGDQPFRREPVINVRAKHKSSVFGEQAEHNKYHLHIFGNLRQVYCADNLLNSALDRQAANVHLAYCGALEAEPAVKEQELQGFYASEYNQRSSYAVAVHTKYKLLSVGVSGLSGQPLTERQIDQFEQLLREEAIVDRLARLEHRRWIAYTRSDGYCLASSEQVRAYFPTQPERKNYSILAKLHPALVPWEQLEEADRLLTQLKGKAVDLKEADYRIVRLLPQILRESE